MQNSKSQPKSRESAIKKLRQIPPQQRIEILNEIKRRKLLRQPQNQN
jgi:hypothetical protein